MHVKGEFARAIAATLQLDPRTYSRRLRPPLILASLTFSSVLSPQQHETSGERADGTD